MQMVLLDNVYASLGKWSAPQWWPGQWPLSPVSLFLSLQKNIHNIIRMKYFPLESKKIYFYLKIYLRLKWTHFHHWLRCIFFHFLVNSFRIISLLLNISARWGKPEVKGVLQAIWNTGAGASCLRNRIHHLFYGNSVESSNLLQTKYFNKIQEK